MNYRKNVAALIKYKKQYLLFKRSDLAGWQCPQGGLEKDDKDEKFAILRELEEELGCDKLHFNIIYQSNVWRKYNFPFEKILKDDIYIGQEQMWFEVEIANLNFINLKKSCGEFCDYKIFSPIDIVDIYVDFKKDTIKSFLKELDLLK